MIYGFFFSSEILFIFDYPLNRIFVPMLGISGISDFSDSISFTIKNMEENQKFFQQYKTEVLFLEVDHSQ